ncbi:hypothetical protein CRG98_009355 [Punica granatum]|uniref:Uncharacterized protein n=1 Tax=Punica granatum TaxID=22663 RepID=A0A2I0KP66_PUNGR|nr:hypothetical protein CRG98_009355 [Punica granatum]
MGTDPFPERGGRPSLEWAKGTHGSLPRDSAAREFGDFWFKSGRVVTGIPGGFPMNLAGFGLGKGWTSEWECSEIVVISVFRGSAPKARRETFVTTETSLGKSSRVPKGHLKLVPRPWWSLGVCRPVLGAVYLSVERAPGALSEKASVRDRGVLAHVAYPGNASGRVVGHFGTERDFWSPILGTFRCFGDLMMNSATVPAPSFWGCLVRSFF